MAADLIFQRSLTSFLLPKIQSFVADAFVILHFHSFPQGIKCFRKSEICSFFVKVVKNLLNLKLSSNNLKIKNLKNFPSLSSGFCIWWFSTNFTQKKLNHMGYS